MEAHETTIDPLTESLELVAERCGDPGDLIYARLFVAFPEMEPLFAQDQDGSVRGEMLSQAFACLMGEVSYSESLIRAERIHHEGFGVDPKAFESFFPVVRDVCREVLGGAWTPAVEAAWTARLAEIAKLVERA